MRINPITLNYYQKKPIINKNSINSIEQNQYNKNTENYHVAFGALVQNSELFSKGYAVANVKDNKLSNDGDSIIITSAAKFLALTNSPNAWNKKIILSNDIDLKGKEIKQIGTAQNPFKGEFDGNGCKISNFIINCPEGRNVGLFGKCENAKLSNLEVKNAFIRGNQQVGGITGYANNCMFNNIFFDGYIEGERKLGGLIGLSKQNEIKNCGTSGTIKAFDISNQKSLFGDPKQNFVQYGLVGGIIGADEKSNISNLYSTCNLYGQEQVGGLIGNAQRSEITWATYNGIINANKKVGGIIGWGEDAFINTAYYLSNPKKDIGYDIRNIAFDSFNNLKDIMDVAEYFDNNGWTKTPDRIPRLKIKVEKMDPETLFLEDINNDIKLGKIRNNNKIENTVCEEINLNITPPKHYDKNNKLLSEIKNSTDRRFLRRTFSKIFVELYKKLGSQNQVKDEYDELIVELVRNKNMDINSVYLERELDPGDWINGRCNPLFILTCTNKAYALKEALKRDDADFTVNSGYMENLRPLEQALNHHIDACAYVMLTTPKMQDYISENMERLKVCKLSKFGKLLLENYPDNIPALDEKKGTIKFTKKFDIPKEFLKELQELNDIESVQKEYAINPNYTDALGNNILNIASKLDEDERALRILIAAEKCGTNIDHWNHKAESPTGHGIYTNKAFFTARILKNTSTPYIRLQDGTDAMLMFSNYPHENEAINFMNIARERGLSVNTHDELGNTPLINAINTKKTENTINYLLTNGANPNICDNFKQTPLHHACINGNVQDMNSIEALIAIETIEKLLDSYAYPFAKDLSGQMPFDYLSEPMKEKLQDKFENLKILYETSGIATDHTFENPQFNLDHYEKIDSLNPISEKVLNGEKTDIEMLQLTKNLQLNDSAANLKDWNNNSILHIAAQSPSPYAKECIKAALEKGIDINAINENKETPLISAINAYILANSVEDQINLMQNIKFIFDAKPNIDLTDNNDQNALHKICQSGNLVLFNEILKFNPKINQIDINGKTPFQYIPENAAIPMNITAREYLRINNIIKA